MTKKDVTAAMIRAALVDGLCYYCPSWRDCNGCLVTQCLEEATWLQEQREQTAEERKRNALEVFQVSNET